MFFVAGCIYKVGKYSMIFHYAKLNTFKIACTIQVTKQKFIRRTYKTSPYKTSPNKMSP
jgi:hypothetical protein